MQQMDDPPSLPVGTEVSAKYKGAFCEAKVSKVVPNIKVRVAYKQGLGTGLVSDDAIKVPPGRQLRVGATVEVRHPERKEYVEATVTKIQDCSQYTVVFDDGDITTLRRTALCLKSGRHFNESETLDQLPLTHPEHFLNPVVGGRRGRRRGHMTGDSSEEEEESDAKEVINEKEEHIGKVVLVETESKKRDKEKWFPALIVAPSAQTTHSVQGRIRVKDEYLVRSFKDGRYYTVPKSEAQDFTREQAEKQDSAAVKAALEYLDSDVLPAHWDRATLFGLEQSSSEEDGDADSDSSDDEPREEKDHFVAQLYKYMDDRGTPLNKVPVIQNRDVDLYRLFRAVQKRGGYNRVTAQNQWKSVATRLGFAPINASVVNSVKQAFKKFLQPYGEFYRKLGCSMLMAPRNSSRSKGRSLVRASTVASPKPGEVKEEKVETKTPTSTAAVGGITNSAKSANAATPVTQSAAEESENTSESSAEPSKTKRKASVGGGKIKSEKISEREKFEDKNIKDEGDVPLAKIKAAVASRGEHKEKEKESPTGGQVNKELGLASVTSASSGQQSSRDPSPAPATSTKKDKSQQQHQQQQTPQQQQPPPQRKQCGPNEDRRGKRKKGEITVEKVDAGDFIIEVNDRLKVYYHEVKGVTYDAKVLEISIQNGTPMYFVHYTGWNNRYDEWVPRERIAENITKGSKHKGRTSSTEQKQKSDNPPKPPSLASLHVSTPNHPLSSGGGPGSSKSVSGSSGGNGKRGRGRSDSNPPRSTTPSSVASNSSRTKSPAASGVKRRPARSMPNQKRRTSAATSDISLASESETDSDEPVRRPTRGAKNKAQKPSKGKISVSATNSHSDTDDDPSVNNMPSTRRRTISGSTASTANTGGAGGAKGRDYDLQQIRSELKGFQGLKTPIPSAGERAATSTSTTGPFEFKTTEIKTEPKLKIEPKEEPTKSSTDMSSETDSFGDDDSQSSDKTTTLENMTKKFQQKIHAEKQKGHGLSSKAAAKTRIVEKIIQEKHMESLRSKALREEMKAKLKIEEEKAAALAMAGIEMKEEDKKPVASVLAPARFGTVTSTTAASATSKFSSVIVEKPLSVGKKMTETTNASSPNMALKKVDSNKKPPENSTSMHAKKANEPAIKDIFKMESMAVGSPSSNSSTSSAASTCGSTRSSLPDMSKLDISSSSSTQSSFASVANKDSKFVSMTAAPLTNKPISPDIYEFKDPEPFEFEMRKPTTSAASSAAHGTTTATASAVTSTSMVANVAPTINTRKQGQKASNTTPTVNHNEPVVAAAQSSVSALVNRKKRGSPLKESVQEKNAKQAKGEDKTGSSTGNTSTQIGPKPPMSQGKAPSNTPSTSSAMLAPPTPNVFPSSSGSSSYLTPQKNESPSGHTPFDVLRKSPSFNLNIMALNEELARTVQETTRALPATQESIQTPGTPPGSETTTPNKMEVASTSKGATGTVAGGSPLKIFATPPKTAKPQNNTASAGSPFVETRKDLSNVFELSSGEGLPGTGENKELENVKKLLSSSAGGFDLMDPTKYENKPTSIADRVLKAINQKKEEVENKNKEIKEAGEKEKNDEAASANALPLAAAGLLSAGIPRFLPHDITMKPSSTTSHTEPLKVNTEFPLTSAPLLSGGGGIKKETFNFKKLTPGTSPEPKIGILEPKVELNETIQKLECAIQRKTPVSCLSVNATPTSTAAPSNYSDDSMDSTDSERRLIIEDVGEEGTSETQKSSPVGQAQSSNSGTPTNMAEAKAVSTISVGVISMPVKLDTSGGKGKAGAAAQQGVQTPIPVKAGLAAQAVGKSPQGSGVLNPSSTGGPTNFAGKIQANNAILINTKTATATVAVGSSTTFLPQSGQVLQGPIVSAGTTITTQPGQVEGVQQANQKQQLSTQGGRAANVVPIIVPDIPASVVVAASAQPSVMAAAQAAATALQTSTGTPTHPKNSATISAATVSIPHPQHTNVQQQHLPSHGPGHTHPPSQNSPYQQHHHHHHRHHSGELGTTVAQRAMESSPRGIKGGPSMMFPYSQTASASFMRQHASSLNSPAAFYMSPTSHHIDGVEPLKHSPSTKSQITSLVVGGHGARSSMSQVVVMPASSSTPNVAVGRKDEPSVGSGGGSGSNDTMNLLCEETIPGEEDEAPTSTTNPVTTTTTLGSTHDLGFGVSGSGGQVTSSAASSSVANSSGAPALTLNTSGNTHSSPNDSGEDESGEEASKKGHETTARKRRRTRKQSEATAASSSGHPTTSSEPTTKRRKGLTGKRNTTAGSDSEDNSDTISQRSSTSAARHQVQQNQLSQHQQTTQQQQQSASGIRPCPYNFLVELDPSLTPDQCISILMKQIQDLRKTYNMIKSELSTVERRRKKLRRREREKKQQQQQQMQQQLQQQQQQQIKIST